MLDVSKIQDFFEQNGLDSYRASEIKGAESGTVTKDALWEYLGYWRCVYHNIVELSELEKV